MNVLLSIVLSLLPIIQGGITVNPDATCPANIQGSYNRATNVLTVCSGLSEYDAQETFAHELVHAAQDAADGINNSTQTTLLTQEQRDALRQTPRGVAVQAILDEYYPVSSHEIEFEAWFFQAQLQAVIFE